MTKHKFKQKKPIPVITVPTYSRLDNIFVKNNWHKDLMLSDNFKERYYATLRTLKQDEQAFFLELTERFLRIPQSQYMDELICPLTYLLEKNYSKKMYFARCIKKEDLGKNKSCEQLLYLFKGQSMKWFIKQQEYKAVTDLKTIGAEELNDGSAILVLLDDFIGTGETAVAALEYVNECIPGITKQDSIQFLCIASLKVGMEYIRERGYKVYTNHVLKKGISDYYKGKDLIDARTKMRRMENRIKKLRPQFRFGYGQSEGLICMERCPNNTFPIYWLTKGVAPYERY